jgi:Ca2+:H+ antiporter
MVLMPEGFAAIKSALRNRLQNSINLALGSATGSIGLTIPTVALASMVLNRQIALGVSQTDMTLLILTLYIDALTLGAGHTTVLQGAAHLVHIRGDHAGLGRAIVRAGRRLGPTRPWRLLFAMGFG